MANSSAPERRFLVLHGWQNHRPQHHWQWQLVEALRARGEQVLYPQLPDPDRPDLDAWTALLVAELAQLGRGERIVVAHSLSVPLWFHVVSALREPEPVDRILLVSPPSPHVLAAYDEVRAFALRTVNPTAIAAAATSTRMVHSDDDPYCPEGAATAYRPLRLDTDVIPGGGHLDPDAGYGTWPAVLTWCLDPRARLTPRTHLMTTPSPRRIQRRRSAGWRTPPGAVYVGRPSKWGNRYRIGIDVRDAAHAVELYERWVDREGLHNVIRAELAGRDLVCWCPPDSPCHADVLLRIANS